MNYCERVSSQSGKVEELRSFIKSKTGLHSYIKADGDSLQVNIVNFSKNLKCKVIFTDFDVIPVANVNNKDLNQLKFVWNEFLSNEFGEEFKTAYHNYYFRNVNVDILKKDDTQER